MGEIRPESTLTFAVVIPAYDCAETIEEIVAAVARQGLPVVVIDDGSTDRTAELAGRSGATVLRHPTNLGKGASLRRGLRWCHERDISHAISMDGDGQHLAGQIPRLLAAMPSSSEPAAGPGTIRRTIVIGQRIIDPQVVAANKLFGNRFANRWVEIACKKSIPDTQSGLRIYPVEETLALDCRAARFAFETEVLIRAVRRGLTIVSVPVEVYYPPADERHSHYHPWLDTVRIIFVVLGLIFRVY